MLGLHPIIHVPNYMDYYSFTDLGIPPDQHHCSDEAKWRLEGVNNRKEKITDAT